MSGATPSAPADLALADAQPELPGLGVLLDDDALTGWVRALLPDAGVAGARASYARLKPGTSCLVALRVSTATGEHLAHARAERADDLRRLGKAARPAPVPSGALGGRVLIDPELALSLAPFPIDRRLPGLRDVVDPQRRPPDLPAGELRVLAYKPERRAVLRVGSGEAAVLLKVYTPAGFEGAITATGAIPSGAGPRVPQALLRLPDEAAIAFEWLAGCALDRLLDAPEACRLASEAGATLHALHQLDPCGGLADVHPAAAARSAAGALAVLVPGVERRAVALADRLQAAGGGGRSVVHGDFSADQVLAGPEGVALLDLDESGAGDPLDDLGSFVGELELRVLTGSLAAGRAAELGAALLEGYAVAAGVAPAASAVRSAAAVALLRRAAEPFRRRRAGWADMVVAAIERAVELERETPRRSPAVSPAQALERLSSLDAPAGLQLERAWPARDGGLLVEYRDATGSVTAARWSPRLRTSASAVLEVSPGLEIELHRGGADPGLPALAGVLARGRAHLIGHQSGRRATVLVDDPGGARFVKVVRPGRAARVVQALATVRSASAGVPIATPLVLEHDDDAGIVECAALPGRPLTPLLGASGAEALARRLGSALGALHAMPIPASLAGHDAGAEIAVLRRWADRVRPFDGRLAETAHEATDDLEPRLSAPPGELAFLHRDLHDGQVLVEDGPAPFALLDFDTVAAGDPALDLANLLVHLELRSHQGACSAAAAVRFGDALLDGYGAGAELRERLGPYGRASRIRLACVYALRPRWRAAGLAVLASPMR